jgi:hypothetical protein
MIRAGCDEKWQSPRRRHEGLTENGVQNPSEVKKAHPQSMTEVKRTEWTDWDATLGGTRNGSVTSSAFQTVLEYACRTD